MKRYLRPLGTALVLVLLAAGAYAASAGDSLISLSYLRQTFFPKAVQAGEEASHKLLQDTYEKAMDQLTAAHAAGSGSAPSDGSYSAVLDPRLWADGAVLTLPTGSGFLLLEGSARLNVTGAVVDVTDGTQAASGTALVPGHRYLVGEDTAASVTVLSGEASMGVQGSYAAAPGKAKHTPFFDTAQGDWFYDPVNFVYEQGLFSGVDGHHFSPGTAMNRAMLLAVLHRLAGSPAQNGGASFTDVPEGEWYSQAIRWGAAQGITSGTGNGTFSPLLQVTREQAVTMLYNCARYLGADVEGGADLSGYGDLNQVSQWARPALAWAVDRGIISGAANGGVRTLDPQRGASRAEMAVMLRSFWEKIL